MGTIKPFDIRRLKPFHREGAHLPGTAHENEDKIAELDPDLKPEEQSYVNHYVHYADLLLDKDEVQEPPDQKVVEMSRKVEGKRDRGQSDESKDSKVA